jgi:hypothetical protein
LWNDSTGQTAKATLHPQRCIQGLPQHARCAAGADRFRKPATDTRKAAATSATNATTKPART